MKFYQNTTRRDHGVHIRKNETRFWCGLRLSNGRFKPTDKEVSCEQCLAELARSVIDTANSQRTQ